MIHKIVLIDMMNALFKIIPPLQLFILSIITLSCISAPCPMDRDGASPKFMIYDNSYTRSNNLSTIQEWDYAFVVDKNGHSIVNHIVENASKIQYEFEYDADGNIVQSHVCESDGHFDSTASYKYDTNGNVIEVIMESTDEDYGFDGTLKYTYNYDNDGNLTQIFGHADNVSTLLNEFQYENGNCIKNINWNWDKSFYETIHTYDRCGNIIESIGFDSEGNTTWRSVSKYNDSGHLIKTTSYDSEDLLEYEVTFIDIEFDLHGNWTNMLINTKCGDEPYTLVGENVWSIDCVDSTMESRRTILYYDD